jgi:hypothetical protein
LERRPSSSEWRRRCLSAEHALSTAEAKYKQLHQKYAQLLQALRATWTSLRPVIPLVDAAQAEEGAQDGEDRLERELTEFGLALR